MEEPPAILLSMSMHGRRCVERIHSALYGIPGVYRVSASRRTGTVVVCGDMRVDASTLQRRLEYYMQRSVTIVTDGGRPRRRSYAPPAAYPYPYPYPYLAQPPPPPYYRLMNGLPSVFDDTIPGNACTIM